MDTNQTGRIRLHNGLEGTHGDAKFDPSEKHLSDGLPKASVIINTYSRAENLSQSRNTGLAEATGAVT
jgi:hypothetical protein